MLIANVVICFVSDVEMNLIGPVTALQLINGSRRILMKARISLGSWPTPSNVLSVGSLLRRTKDATICHAECVATISVGSA